MRTAMNRRTGSTRIPRCVLLLGILFSLASANIFFLEPEHANVVNLEGAGFVDITLRCIANLTRVKYQWMKNGKVISTEDHSRFLVNNDGSLKISRVRASDNGSYQCLASNNEGTALSNSGSIIPKYFRAFQDEIRPPVTTKQGVGVKLTCNGTNFSPENSVHYSWDKEINFYRLGSPGTPEYHVSQTDGTLYLSNPTIADSDVYSCYITGKDEYFNIYMEHYSHGVNLTVNEENQEHEPVIMLQPKSTTYVHVGEATTLECFASGNPTPTIHWKKVNDSLPPSHVITSAGQLELHDVTKDMAGVYECEAKNKLGTVRSIGTLKIADKPTWVTRISQQIVQHGGTAKFHCKATSLTPPNYTWLKNGTPVNVTPIVNITVGKEGGSVMAIAEVNNDDVAIYQCLAENIAGSLYSNAKLSLKDNVFLGEPSDQHVRLYGGTKQVTFKCGSNLIKPKTTWLKDGHPFITNDGYRTNGKGALTISPVRVSDAGNYQCLTTSHEGTALSNAGKLEITYMNDFRPRSKYPYRTEAGKGIAIPCEKANFAPDDNSVFFVWEAIGAFIIYVKPGRADYYVSQNGTLYFANPTTDLTDAYYCFIRDKWNLPSGRRIQKSSTDVYLKVTKSDKRNPPTILLNPKDVTYAKVGSNVMVECFAGGNPTPTLMWKKINGSLPSNHVITQAGQLELHDVTYDVTGTYRCTASNKQGSITTQGDIIVSEPLFYKRRIFSQNVDFHTTATFRCEAFGIPPPTYKWLKNGAPIEMTSHVGVGVGTEGGSVMTIAEVGEDDVAIYQCVAENPLENLTSNAVLRITEMEPRFVADVDERVVKSLKNKTCIMNCTVEGYPRPHIYWMKNGVNTTNSIKIAYNGSLTKGAILIRSTSKSDEGTYTCTATNDKGTITNSRRLEVYVKASIEVLRGQIQSLQCKETHDKRLKTKWSWTHVVDGNETDLLHYTNGTIQLKEVGDDQAGSYKCCASTQIDRSCATIHLRVADFPSPPINVDVISSTNTSQNLAWDDQSNDVTKYKVNGRLEQDVDWFTLECDVNKPCFALNLLPYNKYIYRVYSINKYGTSNASDISKPQRTMGGAPTLAPSGVNATLKDGNLSVTWNTYPAKHYGSAKVVYTLKYRFWYNAQSDDGNVRSEWFELNETHSTATSKFVNISKTQNSIACEVKILVSNQFGQSSSSEVIEFPVPQDGEEISLQKRLIIVLKAMLIMLLLLLLVLLVLLLSSIYKRKRWKEKNRSRDAEHKESSEKFELQRMVGGSVVKQVPEPRTHHVHIKFESSTCINDDSQQHDTYWTGKEHRSSDEPQTTFHKGGVFVSVHTRVATSSSVEETRGSTEEDELYPLVPSPGATSTFDEETQGPHEDEPHPFVPPQSVDKYLPNNNLQSLASPASDCSDLSSPTDDGSLQFSGGQLNGDNGTIQEDWTSKSIQVEEGLDTDSTATADRVTDDASCVVKTKSADNLARKSSVDNNSSGSQSFLDYPNNCGGEEGSLSVASSISSSIS